MENKAIIYQKLEAFIKKFYYNELIKGVLFTVGLGLLYFIITSLIEYFLWLPSNIRIVLFWLFVLVQFTLVSKFIIYPLVKLFKLIKGLNYNEAASIIGNHFSEVKDKLLNFLQLANTATPSELVLASIDQKAASLNPVPFTNAIQFNKNKKYIPLALIPILILLFFYISGKKDVVSSSFNRILQYEKTFEKPAPFQFVIENENLMGEQNKNYQLIINTQGTVSPENVSIVVNNEEYLLEKNDQGKFIYTFENLQVNQMFHLKSNDITSNDFTLKVAKVPTITAFQMVLNYPKHLGKTTEIIQGTGNAVVPEGTTITWKINTLATTQIQFLSSSITQRFLPTNNTFNFSKTINNTLDYTLETSNASKKKHEALEYKISVLNDQFPVITANQAPDSLALKQKVIIGNVSDDYGLSKLQVVYYNKTNPKILFKKALTIKGKTVDQFMYSFPDGIELKPGFEYEYYFEIFDNDAVNNFKSSKSFVFTHNELTAEQKEEKALQEQQSNLNGLQNALNKQDKQQDDFEKLKALDKQKENLDYKDQKKIQDVLNRQKQQDEMMQQFSQKLRENLQEFKPETNDAFKEELLKRLEKNEKEAQKNEKLLKELEELTKKLQKDELFDKTEQLQKQAKAQQKSLEQLLELTKKYYVEQKAEQLLNKLENLANKQEKLSDKPDNSTKEQEKLSKEFDELKKELDQLEKENKELKEPMEMPDSEKEEQDIDKDQKNAEENLQKNNKQNAQKSQKSAASKMKKMASKMKDAMEMGEMEQNEEDAKVLRQILDNLLTFSFDQEKLLNTTKQIQGAKTNIATQLKKQQDLKLQFKHVDDSLFALSLRQPKISEMVLKEVEEVHYNLDKSIELLVSNRYKGISHQQYTLASANKLADMLSNTQDDMNNAAAQMSGGGKPKPGKGKGKQLSDIIMDQKGISEKIKQGMNNPKPGASGQPKQGENGSQGNDGKDGEKEAQKLLDIMKEQQELREQLQNSLNKDGKGGQGNNALQQMKDLEKQLINKGLNHESLNKALKLEHELLKLETALKQQGQDTKREATTNTKDFLGTNKPLPPSLLNYIKSVEILNRQSLPLQPNFNKKVQDYFNSND